MSANSESTSIGFCGLLTLVFVTLKLTAVIDWSWLWVLSPLWLPVILVLAPAITVVILMGLYEAIKHFMSDR